MRHAIVREIRTQESLDVVGDAARIREPRAPVARARRHDVAERELPAILVLLRAARIVVCIDRNARRQLAAFARMRARRILIEEIAVGIDREFAAADLTRAAIKQVRAIPARAIAAELDRIGVEQQRLPPRGVRIGKRHRRRNARAAAAADADFDARGSLPGRVVDHVDHADEARRAVAHGRGALEHFDALDVRDVERRERGRERAAPRNAVDDEQERIELAQAPECGHRRGRTAVAAGRDVDACDERERGSKIVRATRLQLVAGDDRDRRGGVAQRNRDLRSRDFDRLELLGFLRLCPRTERQQDHKRNH